MCTSGDEGWDWDTCVDKNDNPVDASLTLAMFGNWDPQGGRTDHGLWHLFHNCLKSGSGTSGVAVTGTICSNTATNVNGRDFKYGNVGLTHYTGDTWLTFAHEVGHNFGASHSFRRDDEGNIVEHYGECPLYTAMYWY